jgi:hypothetical protein
MVVNEIRQTKKYYICMILLMWNTESTKGIAQDCKKEMGSYCLMCIEFLFEMTKKVLQIVVNTDYT